MQEAASNSSRNFQQVAGCQLWLADGAGHLYDSDQGHSPPQALIGISSATLSLQCYPVESTSGTGGNLHGRTPISCTG